MAPPIHPTPGPASAAVRSATIGTYGGPMARSCSSSITAPNTALTQSTTPIAPGG